MIIVGEKINGTRASVKKAVLERDAAAIRDLAQKQVDAGANYLDVNAGTPVDREPDDLIWLVETIQAAMDIPLCLDSSNNEALQAAIGHTQKTPLINSISGEKMRLTGTLPLAAQHKCPVIALALDDKGIPKDAEGRMVVLRKLFQETRQAGMPDSTIYVDPLATALVGEKNGSQVTWAVMRAVRQEFPEAHFSVGLSNVSYGLPARSLINRAFLAISLAEGLDMAIMDPLDRGVMEVLFASRAVLGLDRFCLNYTKAFRAGKIGPPQTANKPA